MGDTRLDELNFITYGMILPVVIIIGIIGSIVNIIVLYACRSKCPCYVYLQGISVCDLLVLIFTIPFTIRLSKSITSWSCILIAWFYAHLDIYLNNTLAGIGTCLMLAITFERYMAFCHPFRARSWQFADMQRCRSIVALIIPILVAILYLPYTMLYDVVAVKSLTVPTNGTLQVSYEYCMIDNVDFVQNEFYKVYKVAKEFIFRLNPSAALLYMNVCIIVAYRRASIQLKRNLCWNRQVASTCTDTTLKEDGHVSSILVGLTIKFILGTVPAAVLALTINDDYSNSFYYNVFRSLANTLEIVKNSTTFLVFYSCFTLYRLQLRRLFRVTYN